MKYTSITVAFLAAFAAAKTIDELVESIPACAITCIRDGAQSVNCDITDFKCSCGKIEQLMPTVVSCISKSSCSAQDQTNVLLASQDICEQVASGASATGAIADPTSTTAEPTMTSTGTGTAAAEAVSRTESAAATTSTPGAAGRVQAAGWAGAVAFVAAFAL